MIKNSLAKYDSKIHIIEPETDDEFKVKVESNSGTEKQQNSSINNEF